MFRGKSAWFVQEWYLHNHLDYHYLNSLKIFRPKFDTTHFFMNENQLCGISSQGDIQKLGLQDEVGRCSKKHLYHRKFSLPLQVLKSIKMGRPQCDGKKMIRQTWLRNSADRRCVANYQSTMAVKNLADLRLVQKSVFETLIMLVTAKEPPFWQRKKYWGFHQVNFWFPALFRTS